MVWLVQKAQKEVMQFRKIFNISLHILLLQLSTKFMWHNSISEDTRLKNYLLPSLSNWAEDYVLPTLCGSGGFVTASLSLWFV